RLTVNACLDAIRRRRRRPIEIRIEPLILPAEGDHQHGFAVRDEIERGLARLSPDQRAVLVLHYFVGLPVPALADTLGIPLGTAQSRLGRALAALRAALRAHERPAEPEPEPARTPEGQTA
ncbi:MAG TPA: sigma-70 family RNA polymerase sigma factor, partial [Candidatus Limnocylindrales bacterium]|nr:sigma-70 family RNA polymerase sigma factor [Candidatus Limnocylindrales bacterium]